jgi:branched-chain amino acid aminotransferase
MPAFAYFQGDFVPLEDAKIGIMTHAFNYGTGCFEGIRGNWNDQRENLFIFRPEAHYARLKQSARILKIELSKSVEELTDITRRLVEMCGYREDVYIRPLAYKSQEVVGVRLHNIEDDFLIFVTPFGNYLDVDAGIHCAVSSWRRIDDNAIPPRAKVTGLYVNSALAKTEALENGFDEAIMLNNNGTVSEGSGENLFLVKDGQLITPPAADNILVGITRETVMVMARQELGLETVERSIIRSELYGADECFLTGTAAHLSPVLSIDRRPIGDGAIGPITAKLSRLYFDVICGKNPAYEHWVRPVYSALHVAR